MKKKKIAVLVAGAFALEPFHPREASALDLLAAAPITFERNLGQFAPDVLYVTRGVRGEIAIRAGEVSVAPANRPAMRLALAGSNPNPGVEGHEPKATRSNYYRGGAQGSAITGVPHFGRVVMKDVYPQVDLAFHGRQDALEYDFLLAPGADPAVIRLDLSGAQDAWIDDVGNLRMQLAGGELTQRTPIAYQVREGQRVPVQARFELRETEHGREAGFVTGAYDRAHSLVIDPILSFSTYLGASGGDWGGHMKADAQGNLHIAYADRQTDASNITITKFDPVAREVLFTTRVDGLYDAELKGLAVGSSGAGPVTYVTGTTDSPYFPVCGTCPPLAGGTDAFVMALDSGGAMVGRLLGGSGADEGMAIATDAAGNVYVTGNTASLDFPNTGAAHHGEIDAFVTLLSADLGTIQSSTLLGSSGDDTAQSIAVDSNGNMYLAMSSTSFDFPAGNPAFGRSFVAKLGASSGDIAWTNFLDLSGENFQFVSVAVDLLDRPVAGGTRSPSRGFVARFDPDTGDADYFGALGGSGMHSPTEVATEGESIYLVGSSQGQFFSVGVPSPAIGASGDSDAFVARFDGGPIGLDFATLIGGTGQDFGQSVAVAPSGLYVSGSTRSANFPTVNPLRATREGESDVFLGKIASEFSFTGTAETVQEHDGQVQFLITRTGSLEASAGVRVTSVNGTALAGTHFGTPGNGTPYSFVLGFPPGVGSAVFSVPLIDDDVIEGNATFTVVLSDASGASLGGVSSRTITIISNEDALLLAADNISVLEGAGVATITVNRQGFANGFVSLDYATANGTALAGTHYTATSGTLFWPSTDHAPKTITVPILDNTVAVAGAGRTFRVNLSNPTTLTLTGPTFATVTIRDDDDTVGLASAIASAAEGVPSVTLLVRRTGSVAGTASATWATTDGTAKAGLDFGTPGEMGAMGGVLQWNDGDASQKSIVIPVIDNGTPQPSRTFTVALSGVTGARTGIASARVTLSDNDKGFALSAPLYVTHEGAGNVTLQVLRGGNSAAAASVRWAAVNVTAIAGQDYGSKGVAAPRSGTLNWVAGDSAPKTIVIPIIQDVASEGAELFHVALSLPSTGMALLTPSSATVAINDDDIPAESSISFVEPKVLVFENGGNAMLTVRREAIGSGFTVPATVSYATVPGSALATSDYTTRTGTLSWATGDSADKAISIPIVNNTVAENPEAFKVTLVATSPGARIDTPEAAVTIIDDDDAFPKFGVVPDGWVVPVDATAGWHASNDPGAYEGVFSLRSDAIEDNETAQIEVTRTFAAGTITFRVKVSSEAGFDKLRFFLDDVEKGAWSGTVVPGWQVFSTPVTAGTHTLRWSYEKDGSASLGQDAAWIDAVVLP